ncbi:MAG: N-6 DNA methylase [Limnochordales bacterium]|nr:N-6 DNA methylase [Limnochordales bacterium]
MSESVTFYDAVVHFAEVVAAKMARLLLTPGEPEDQLRGPFESFMVTVGRIFYLDVSCIGETPLPERLGRPDYAVHVDSLLVGYVELKAPGSGANVRYFTGHNRQQWKRFSVIPNLLYTDGSEWVLCRNGKLERIVRLSGDFAARGKVVLSSQDVDALERLLRDFLSWRPIIPVNRSGQINLKDFARLLAPICRMLRDDVIDALKRQNSSLVQLAKDWRQLLFPDATDAQFADAYAQTVTFALLLARSEGADPLTLEEAVRSLTPEHNLLSRALQVLTDIGVRDEISASLNLLLRVIGEVPPYSLVGNGDPWLYFYEDFLGAYDPKLRKDAGVYYTPVQVVHAQVRLIDDLLVNRFGKPLGFAEPGVVTLDPACGTGTYLLGVIEHALGRVKNEQGIGAVPGQASVLANNLYGFELLVGPYAVAQLRVSRALLDHGAQLPSGGTRVYLTDTLESPHAKPPQVPLFLRPIADEHARALKVKSDVPVIVCLGNPPYDRHEAARTDNRARTGGWVRWGDPNDPDSGKRPILRDFLDPAIAAGHGRDVKNLYNLYVYFWRWALWKVLEQMDSGGPGVISFISASSYLDGDAFCGMREYLRRQCDEIWVLDLGGEKRGPRKDDNIFPSIRTPVAIAIAMRSGPTNENQPAKVHYARIEGSRDAKLATLDTIAGFGSVKWQDCPNGWHDPFRPVGKGEYFRWPLLTDLMPWQHSGVQWKRTWPICHDPETLRIRWTALLNAKDMAEAFRETPDRKITVGYPSITGDKREKPLVDLPKNTPAPRIERYAYRSFDRQWVLADNRLGDRLRPHLWRVHSERQIYITTLLHEPLGAGPALTACAAIPDLHHFKGSFGAKDTIPLYRSSDASEANIIPGLLELLGKAYGRDVTPEDFLAYVYGVLAQPAFTVRYAKELETCELRVPFTKNAELFEKVRKVGAHLLWLHTYGERLVPPGKPLGYIPPGEAKCVKAVPGDPDRYPESFYYDEETRTLHVGEGEFRPVSSEVYRFEVSGLVVVQSWLSYRMKHGAGKKSSPLDLIRPERWTGQCTTELLELLWVLEETVASYPEQEKLLEAIVTGPCFESEELPPVPDEMRNPPTLSRIRGGTQEQLL